MRLGISLGWKFIKKVCLYALLIFCLIVTGAFMTFHLGVGLGIGGAEDQEISRKYERIYRVASRYGIKEKPKAQAMRPAINKLSMIPLIGGNLRGAELLGYFSVRKNLIVVKKCDDVFRDNYDQEHCEDFTIAHELGHAVGWNSFCQSHPDCEKKITEYSLSYEGSEKYANIVADKIMMNF